MMESLVLVVKGAVIGVANIIPGVSGGTMAVVLGLYERLIEAISNIVTDRGRRFEYARFLLAVGIGAVLAIGILSWLMDFLLTEYEVYTYLFFIGLIAGSVPSIYRAHHDMRFGWGPAIAFLLGVALILGVALGFPHVEEAKEAAAGQASGGAPWMLFVAGIFAGGSMIVPGISGSFVMVLLGQYHAVIRAIKAFDPVRIGAVGAGALLGVWIFAKLIDVSLRRFPRATFYFILGLVIASLYPIFPGFPPGTLPTIAATAIGLAGAAVSLLLGRPGTSAR